MNISFVVIWSRLPLLALSLTLLISLCCCFFFSFFFFCVFVWVRMQLLARPVNGIHFYWQNFVYFFVFIACSIVVFMLIGIRDIYMNFKWNIFQYQESSSKCKRKRKRQIDNNCGYNNGKTIVRWDAEKMRTRNALR